MRNTRKKRTTNKPRPHSSHRGRPRKDIIIIIVDDQYCFPQPRQVLRCIKLAEELIPNDLSGAARALAGVPTAFRNDPNYLRAQIALGVLRRRSVTALLTRYSKLYPTDPWPSKVSAALALRKGDKRGALKILSSLRDIKNDPQIPFIAAAIFHSLDDSDCVEILLQQVAAERPELAALAKRFLNQ